MSSDKNYYINEHRKMWNWIAEQYKNGSQHHVLDLKTHYLYIHGFSYMLNHCFLCDYAGYNSKRGYIFNANCDRCPLDWGTPKYTLISEGFCTDYEYFDDRKGLYSKLCFLTDRDSVDSNKAYELSKQIAELPIKEYEDVQ